MNKQWKEYYSRNIDMFVENFLGIKLLPFQRIILKSCNKKLDKQATLDMAKFYNPQSSVYMNMYFWSSMGSKYGYDRCDGRGGNIKMKGKQLTLEEVLKLEDGTKVWVESKYYENKGQISYVISMESKNMRLSDFYDISSGFYSQDTFKNLEIFELIEVGNEIVYNMATEICNLRGIDLTEDNIDKIMKEFVDKE